MMQKCNEKIYTNALVDGFPLKYIVTPICGTGTPFCGHTNSNLWHFAPICGLLHQFMVLYVLLFLIKFVNIAQNGLCNITSMRFILECIRLFVVFMSVKYVKIPIQSHKKALDVYKMASIYHTNDNRYPQNGVK